MCLMLMTSALCCCRTYVLLLLFCPAYVSLLMCWSDAFCAYVLWLMRFVLMIFAMRYCIIFVRLCGFAYVIWDHRLIWGVGLTVSGISCRASGSYTVRHPHTLGYGSCRWAPEGTANKLFSQLRSQHVLQVSKLTTFGESCVRILLSGFNSSML